MKALARICRKLHVCFTNMCLHTFLPLGKYCYEVANERLRAYCSSLTLICLIFGTKCQYLLQSNNIAISLQILLPINRRTKFLCIYRKFQNLTWCMSAYPTSYCGPWLLTPSYRSHLWEGPSHPKESDVTLKVTPFHSSYLNLPMGRSEW